MAPSWVTELEAWCASLPLTASTHDTVLVFGAGSVYLYPRLSALSLAWRGASADFKTLTGITLGSANTDVEVVDVTLMVSNATSASDSVLNNMISIEQLLPAAFLLQMPVDLCALVAPPVLGQCALSADQPLAPAIVFPIHILLCGFVCAFFFKSYLTVASREDSTWYSSSDSLVRTREPLSLQGSPIRGVGNGQ